MMHSLFSFSALAAIITLSSCDSDPVNQVTLPENLQISALVSETGLAEITAQADLTNFYTATVWTGTDSIQFQEASGNFSWQLPAPGNYAYRVRAHTTATDFIEKSDSLSWFVDTSNSGSFPSTGYSTPTSYPGYTLVWSDEFSGNALSADWVYDIGTGNSGWGNNELQYYTNQNVRVQQGVLEITAKKEPFNTSQYTSTRIKTQGQKSWKYGRIDIRAAMP
ncbi:MAG: glycoside hydrolase family 16 protein, partial [Flavobacteriales bacterium]